MVFYAFGFNHLRASVDVREAFTLDEEGKRKLHRRLQLAAESEVILLSTCNRTEAYLFGSVEDVKATRNALSETAGIEWPDDSAFLVEDEEAVRHVLEVAAGLKSLVLGDAQIFAQLKEAYRIAVEEQRVGTSMHRLMHTAFRTAKRVINETDLTTGASSVPYQAVEIGKAHFQSRSGRALEDLSALVVGTGTMGRLSAEALKLAGMKDLAFTNRSEDHGRDVAARYHASFILWNARHSECRRRDLVIVTTSARVPVIEVRKLKDVRERGETLFIDLSVPRNVESSTGDLPGIDVVGFDEINQLLDDTEVRRKTAVPEAGRIVSEMLSEFVSWVFHRQALDPAIQAIADTFEAIRRQEVRRHHQRLSDTDKEELDRITRSIIQKILAVPVVRLKSVDPESIDFVRGIRLLHALFRRDECDDHENEEIDDERANRSDPDRVVEREDYTIAPQIGNRQFNNSSSDGKLDNGSSDGKLDNGSSDGKLDEVLRLFARSDADESE